MVKSAGAVAPKASGTQVTIQAPTIRTATFHVVGTAPLVVHRFSWKVKKQMTEKMEAGSQGKSKRTDGHFSDEEEKNGKV